MLSLKWFSTERVLWGFETLVLAFHKECGIENAKARKIRRRQYVFIRQGESGEADKVINPQSQ